MFISSKCSNHNMNITKVIIKMLVFTLLIFSLLGSGEIVFAVGNEVAQQPEIKVFIDGKQVAFPDQKPMIDKNNRTLVPVRFISENLGAEVAWDGDQQLVTVEKDGKALSFKIGDNTIKVNDPTNGVFTSFQIDTAATLEGGRTLVPLRFITEAFGSSVSWDGKTNTVLIYSDSYVKPGTTVYDSQYVVKILEDVLKGKGNYTFKTYGDSNEFSIHVWRDTDEYDPSFDFRFNDNKLEYFVMGVGYDKNYETGEISIPNFDLSKEILNKLGVPVTDTYVKDMVEATKHHFNSGHDVTKTYGNYSVEVSPSNTLSIGIGVRLNK